ncbi:MAG: chemotaxis protein CheW [Desulfovermiculus sp.]
MNAHELDTQEVMTELAGKYLTFYLGEEGYGLEILKVQEIIGMQEITRIPKTPDYVKGVINLRGKVIPVVDLRLKFGMLEKEVSRKTCIIVTQVQRGNLSLIIGIVVD